MDWTQTIALGGTLIAYMTGMCIFLYRLNEKSITEWRDEHSKQIDKLDRTLQQNEAHWREMFTHFNTRLDKVTDKG
jgi:hypothetical protein